MSHTWSAVPVVVALVVGAVAACARQGAPPGGPQDLLSPVVVSTRPDTFERVETVEDRILIRFNERISERPTSGTLDQAVVISPQSGEVRVGHSRESLEVEMTGGFRPGLVYRVTVLPVISDLFNNTMRRPFEFAFSTGGELHQGVVAGMVLDRITGEPVDGARVHMTASEAGQEPVVYVSRTDTSGIYAFRFMPPARYDLVAFQDRNRDRIVDPFEVQGRSGVLLGETDTLISQVVVLPLDTTRARLAEAAVEDSALVRLVFDDYLDPLQDADRVEVYLDPVEDTLQELPDPPPPPAVHRVLHVHEYRAWVDSVAAADTLEDAAAVEEEEPDTARAEIDGVELDDVEGVEGVEVDDAEAEGAGAERARVAGADRPGARAAPGAGGIPEDPGTLPDGTPLPTRSLIVFLRGPLPVDVPYRLTVREATNVNGLTGGDGEATVVREGEPARAGASPTGEGPQDAAADTADAAADTIDAAADTADAAADTIDAAADTIGVAGLPFGGRNPPRP